jgi:hypothetical protein
VCSRSLAGGESLHFGSRFIEVRLSQTGGIRSGELSLRQQRMTQPMVETLRMEKAQIHMSLVSYDTSHDTHKSVNCFGGRYYPPPQEFVYLRTKITNLSRTSFINLTLGSVTHAILDSVTSSFYCRSGGGTGRACRTRGHPYRFSHRPTRWRRVEGSGDCTLLYCVWLL